MIIYEREKKEIIVPATFAGVVGGDCGPEIEIAYQEGWNEGYASGTSECSGCTLQEGGYFTPLWPETPTGIVEVFPDEGYDGFSKFSVNDGAALWSFHAAGLEAGRESGYAEGWQSGYTSGYTKGYEDGAGEPPSTSFKMAYSGTMILETDEVINRNHQIWILFTPIAPPWDGSGALDQDYIEIDGQPLTYWMANESTLSAGTHTFFAHLGEYYHAPELVSNFIIEQPAVSVDSYNWHQRPTFNVNFVFRKYK